MKYLLYILLSIPIISFSQEKIEGIILETNTSLQEVGLLGVNGEGKSTFSKLIAKKIKLINGSLQIPQKLKIGYFAQHQLDELRPKETAFEHVYAKLNSEIPFGPYIIIAGVTYFYFSDLFKSIIFNL